MKTEMKDERSIGEGKYAGHCLIVRQNVGVRPVAGDARYPFRVASRSPSRPLKKRRHAGRRRNLAFEPHGRSDLRLFGREAYRCIVPCSHDARHERVYHLFGN